MASRAAQVRDACVSAITAAWSPADPDGVEGVWAKDLSFDADHAEDLLTGRRVYVFAVSHTQPSLLDRELANRRYVVGVLVAERYTDQPGPVPTEWVDERVAFVETTILGVLANPALMLLDGEVRQQFDEEQGIDALCDRELLQQDRVFWSVSTFVFQEAV